MRRPCYGGGAVAVKGVAVARTPPQDAQAVLRREIELALRRYYAGDAPGARYELERSLSTLPAGEDRARVLIELASVTWNQQGGDQALAMISRALDEAASPSLRAQIHSRASWIAEDVDQGLAHAEAALD